VDTEENVLVRMHRGSTLADTFSSTSSDGRRNLLRAIDMIEAHGRGVVVYLPPKGDISAELAVWSSPALHDGAGDTRAHGGTLREYGLGAQILRDLGLRNV